MGGVLLLNCIKVSKYMYQAHKKVKLLEICICRKLHFIVVIATLLKMSINLQKGRWSGGGAEGSQRYILSFFSGGGGLWWHFFLFNDLHHRAATRSINSWPNYSILDILFSRILLSVEYHLLRQRNVRGRQPGHYAPKEGYTPPPPRLPSAIIGQKFTISGRKVNKS